MGSVYARPTSAGVPNRIEFDVTDNGARFLLLEPAEQTAFQSLSLVTRWLPR